MISHLLVSQPVSNTNGIQGPAGICDFQTFTYSVTGLPASDTQFHWIVGNYEATPQDTTTTTPTVNLLFGAYKPTVGTLTVTGLPSGQSFMLNLYFLDPVGSATNKIIHMPNRSICKNKVTEIGFRADSVSNATRYLWVVPDSCEILDGQGTDSIYVRFNNPTKSTDTIEVIESNCKNSVSLKRQLDYYNFTDISITIANNHPVCKSDTITFIANPTNALGNPVYKWYKNGVLQQESNNRKWMPDTSVVKLKEGDVVTCKLYADTLLYPCYNPGTYPATDTAIITNGLSAPEIVQKDAENKTGRVKDSYIFICTSCQADTMAKKITWCYRYKSSDSIYLTETLSSYQDQPFCRYPKKTTQTNYYVKFSYKSHRDCEDSIPLVPVTEDLLITNRILCPNPNHGQFTLEILNPYEGPVNVVLFDLLGKEIQEIRLEKIERYLSVPFRINPINKGPYLIETRLGNGERFIDKVFIY